MGTDWTDTPDVAGGFDAYDDLPERLIGYPAAFGAARLGDPDVRTVLDYGCGPGKVARRVAAGYGVEVVAVDISEPMLRIARERRAHPRVRYRRLDHTRLAFLPDDSVDAALCCYVFINIGDLAEIRAIAAEVRRVLRPGGRFAVLDTHPETTGIRFSTFESGEPGRRYAAGQRRRVLLYRPDGGVLELIDHHWPRQTYLEVLAGAGFREVGTAAPRLGEVAALPGSLPDGTVTRRGPDGGVAAHASAPDGVAVSASALPGTRAAEAVHPPFLITTGVK